MAACAAGLGVTFRADAVRARFGDETLVLLTTPRYEARPEGAGSRVRIYYSLPHTPGGVRADLGRGVIELERSPAGRLRPVAGWFTDLQTGAAHARLAPGPLDDMLNLGLCPRDASPAEAPRA
ncbi:MAG: hypothetical protein AB7M12_07505 [Hyphomonadaceae bacterium]